MPRHTPLTTVLQTPPSPVRETGSSSRLSRGRLVFVVLTLAGIATAVLQAL